MRGAWCYRSAADVSEKYRETRWRIYLGEFVDFCVASKLPNAEQCEGNEEDAEQSAVEGAAVPDKTEWPEH